MGEIKHKMIKNDDFLDNVWAELDKVNTVKSAKKHGKISWPAKIKLKHNGEHAQLKESFKAKNRKLTEDVYRDYGSKLLFILFPTRQIPAKVSAEDNRYTHREVYFDVPVEDVAKDINNYDYLSPSYLAGADFDKFNDWLKENKGTDISDIYDRLTHDETNGDEQRGYWDFDAIEKLLKFLTEYLSTESDLALKLALINYYKNLCSNIDYAKRYSQEIKPYYEKEVADGKAARKAAWEGIRARQKAKAEKDALYQKLYHELDNNKLKQEYEAAGIAADIEDFYTSIPDDYTYEGLGIPVESEWSEMRQGSGDPDTDYEATGTAYGTLDDWNFEVFDAFDGSGKDLAILTAWAKAYKGLDITKETLKQMEASGDDKEFAEFIIDLYENDAIDEAQEAVDSEDYDPDEVHWEDRNY